MGDRSFQDKEAKALKNYNSQKPVGVPIGGLWLVRLGSCKPRFIARPRRTGNSGACPVTSPLAQLFSFLRDTSLSGLAQARFSPPPLRPLFRDFGVGGATGKRVPRNVYKEGGD